MSFSYKTHSREYIDTSEVTDQDRIKLTFEDGNVVTLMKNTEDRYRDIVVDRANTSSNLLEAMYKHVVDGFEHSRRSARMGWRQNRQERRNDPSLDEVRKGAWLEVSVSASGDAFDDSPHVGERLRVMPTMPDHGGSSWDTPCRVTSVEFYTL